MLVLSLSKDDPGLVDEDQTALINFALMGLPSGTVTSEL
jgi:hypothetical protein